jgi:hypothetical protein
MAFSRGVFVRWRISAKDGKLADAGADGPCLETLDSIYSASKSSIVATSSAEPTLFRHAPGSLEALQLGKPSPRNC